MDKHTFYITSKMAKRTNDLEKCTYNAEEALNLIISEDYSFGTSSSEDSSQLSSSYDSINGNSLSPSPILKNSPVRAEVV